MNVQVNLLPEAKLSKMRNKAKRRNYTTITILVAVAVAVVCVMLVMLRFFLVGTYNLDKNKKATLQSEVDKQKDLEEKATTLQQNLNAFYTLNSTRTYASAIINNFFKAVPENVTISSIALDEKGKVTISGTTGSFADVSRFQSSLELYNVDFLPQPDLDRKAVFTNVSISSVNKAEGKTSFSITFDVQKEVLKGQKK
jgi:Tfp pilus assembly protein PilN